MPSASQALMAGTEDPEEPAEPETFPLPAGSLSHLADLLGELDAFLRSGHPAGGQLTEFMDAAVTRTRASPPAT
jgi:hypothetical protein